MPWPEQCDGQVSTSHAAPRQPGLQEHWLLELTPAFSTRMAERSMHQPCPEQCSGQPPEAPDSHATPVKPASQTHEPESHRPRPWQRAGHAEVPQSFPRQLASQRQAPSMHAPFPWQSAGQPPFATRGVGCKPTKPAANGKRSSMLLLLRNAHTAVSPAEKTKLPSWSSLRWNISGHIQRIKARCWLGLSAGSGKIRGRRLGPSGIFRDVVEFEPPVRLLRPAPLRRLQARCQRLQPLLQLPAHPGERRQRAAAVLAPVVGVGGSSPALPAQHLVTQGRSLSTWAAAKVHRVATPNPLQPGTSVRGSPRRPERKRSVCSAPLTWWHGGWQA